ncbi:hypothetical protein, partial [Microcystis sp.]|uniref:hypothetical protein n=1 Tax=Microcystis sp. TaxID=1127 RepID=UPI003918EF20
MSVIILAFRIKETGFRRQEIISIYSPHPPTSLLPTSLLPTPYTPHPTPHTLHPTPYTPSPIY